MPSEEETLQFNLHIDAGDEIDDEELDRFTRQLRAEIEELDVESVDLVKEQTVPKGSKDAEAVTLGALAVTLLPVVVPKLLDFLQSWCVRKNSQTVKIKSQVGDRLVEVEFSPSTTSPTELQELVKALRID